jgi:sulfite exporter TauE/SafE
LDLINHVKSYLPWIAFASGLAASLHCVGMCGGLVAASTQKTSDIFRYQVGRLLGYLFIGYFAGLLGSLMKPQLENPKLNLIPGILMGLIFIYWGVQNYRGKKSFIIFNIINAWIYKNLFPIFVFKNYSVSKSFFIGLFSIFLPCGLLYGVVIGIATLNHSLPAVLTMLFFWLGTLPAMMLAPSIVHKILRPLKSKLPRTYAFSLIALGILTITVRVIHFNQANAQQISTKFDITTTPKCH